MSPYYTQDFTKEKKFQKYEENFEKNSLRKISIERVNYRGWPLHSAQLRGSQFVAPQAARRGAQHGIMSGHTSPISSILKSRVVT